MGAAEESSLMGEILIRFVRGSSWDSMLIEYRTRAWCSHVEALFPERGKTFGAMLRGGVQVRSLESIIYKYVAKEEVWKIPCADEQQKAFWDFLNKQAGKPYDWRAIISFGFGERDWTEEDSWFCSELQVAAAVAAKLWVFSKQAHIDRIDPGMAYLLFTTLPGARCQA